MMSEYNDMKIGYFADGPWAHQAFDKLLMDKALDIRFVCLRYDTPDEKLKAMALENNIDVLCHENVNSEDFLKVIKEYSCDIFISMSFNQIFKKEIINLTKLKCINCHAGKLPYYRGRNILNWALINDEKEFGITVHYIDEGIDTGDIIYQKCFEITDEDNYQTLLNRASKKCAEVLYEGIKVIQQGKEKNIHQKNICSYGTYFGMRQEGDEYINWSLSSREIFNFIRAICSPGPMARSFICGKEIKINKAQYNANLPIYKNTVGQVVGKYDNNLIIKTGDTTIEITEYIYDGKIKIGDRLTGLPIVIFGDSGVCKEVYCCIKQICEKSNGGGYPFEILGFIGENQMQVGNTVIDNKKVIACDDELANLFFRYDIIGVIIPFGNATLKNKIYSKIKNYTNIKFPNVIHPSVTYDNREAILGRGNVIVSGSVIAANLVIGDFNLININCTIGHDVVIGNFNTVNPLVAISGNVNIGNNCMVGAGAVVLQGLTIEDEVKIGAGAVLTTNAKKGLTYVGIPARPINEDEE